MTPFCANDTPEAAQAYELGLEQLEAQEPIKAFTTLCQAFELGSDDARYLLENPYMSEDYENEWDASFMAHIRELAEAGHPIALYQLGWDCYIEEGIDYHEQSRAYFKQAAEQGLCMAQYRLAESYIVVGWREKNYEEVIELLEQSAAQNYREAEFELVQIWTDELSKAEKAGQPEDSAKREHARKFIDRAAEHGQVDAMMLLARLRGDEPEQYDFTRDILPLYMKSIEAGEPDAMQIIGTKLLRGEDMEQDVPRGINYMKEAADLGQDDAMVQLASLHLAGIHVESSTEKALNYVNEALKFENGTAAYILGFLYETGYGVSADESKAIDYYKQSADFGEADGMVRYAKILLSDRDIGNNYKIAFGYLKQAEVEEHAEALLQLAFCHMRGLGCEADKSLTTHYFLRAATQGNRDAQRFAGLIYEIGQDQPRDLRQARYWYQAAAEQGDATAMKELSRMYAEGKGGKKDRRLAKQWLQAYEKNKTYEDELDE